METITNEVFATLDSIFAILYEYFYHFMEILDKNISDKLFPKK